jgi:D-alanine-D-alanine ligase
MGSAASMDKDVTNCLMRVVGLPIVPFVTMSALLPIACEDAVRIVGTSGLFMKSANMGSSVGFSSVRTANEFAASCKLSLRFDKKILIEPCVSSARESSAPSWRMPMARVVHQSSEKLYLIANAASIRTTQSASMLRCPHPHTCRCAESDGRPHKELAIRSFDVLRVRQWHGWDCFLSDEPVFVNETNTLAGFTNVSMHPKLWEARGLPQSEPMTTLIAHALRGARTFNNSLP